MRKFGYARNTSKFHIPREAIVLNPTASGRILPSDRLSAEKHGLVVIDCSWNLADGVFHDRFRGQQRKLPLLLAGNPTNYSKLSSLSSLEAVSASLYIMEFKELAKKMLSLYKWGDTFLTLNHDLLEDYSRAKDEAEVGVIEREYFPLPDHG
jgi:pre-rRNA-processing protein TSR3